MSISNLSEVNNLTVKAMYRLFLKNMRYYPSKNRFEVLLAVKEEFHDHKAITDERQIRIEKYKPHFYYFRRIDCHIILNLPDSFIF